MLNFKTEYLNCPEAFRDQYVMEQSRWCKSGESAFWRQVALITFEDATIAQLRKIPGSHFVQFSDWQIGQLAAKHGWTVFDRVQIEGVLAHKCFQNCLAEILCTRPQALTELSEDLIERLNPAIFNQQLSIFLFSGHIATADIISLMGKLRISDKMALIFNLGGYQNCEVMTAVFAGISPKEMGSMQVDRPVSDRAVTLIAMHCDYAQFLALAQSNTWPLEIKVFLFRKIAALLKLRAKKVAHFNRPFFVFIEELEVKISRVEQDFEVRLLLAKGAMLSFALAKTELEWRYKFARCLLQRSMVIGMNSEGLLYRYPEDLFGFEIWLDRFKSLFDGVSSHFNCDWLQKKSGDEVSPLRIR